MKQEPLHIDNPAIFKAKDIGLVNKVQKILQDFNITPTISGGLRRNLENGFPRTYRDIDLVVDPITDNLKARDDRGKAIMAFYNLSKQDNGELRVEDITEQFGSYVGVDVEYRFRVFSPETRSTVDITFGKYSDPEKDLRGENIDTPTHCLALGIIARKPGSYKYD